MSFVFLPFRYSTFLLFTSTANYIRMGSDPISEAAELALDYLDPQQVERAAHYGYRDT